MLTQNKKYFDGTKTYLRHTFFNVNFIEIFE